MRILRENRLVRGLTVAGLVLAGLLALVTGVGAWMVSSCCGSPDPPQDGYLLLGLAGAVVLWVLAAAAQQQGR